MRNRTSFGWFAGVAVLSVACSESALYGPGGGAGAGGGPGASSVASGGTAASGGEAPATTSSEASSGVGGAPPMLYDPDQDGPYATTEGDAKFTVAATKHEVPIHYAHPVSGPDAGPFPVVVFGHGFNLPPKQYYSYVRRLATFGYVAMTVDYPTAFLGNSHVENAKDLIAGLDWASSDPTVAAIADAQNAGASGHSLGGKLAVLAAAADPRVKASLTLDPVDGATACSLQDCPDATNLLPLAIPLGFVGETTDAAGFQPCAPAAVNFATFFTAATAPSLSVEVLGASHMAFLDDMAGCGLSCNFCQKSQVDSAVVGALSRAMMVAFYERYLKGRVAYDAFLTGAEAQARYVDTGLAKILAK